MTKQEIINIYYDPIHKLRVLIDGKVVQYLWDIDVAIEGVDVNGKKYINFTAADLMYRSSDVDVEDGWCVYNDTEEYDRMVPLLRTVDSMTDEIAKSNYWKSAEDFKMFISLHSNGERDIDRRWYAGDFIFLIKHKIDLFHAIEDGLALDMMKYQTL